MGLGSRLFDGEICYAITRAWGRVTDFLRQINADPDRTEVDCHSFVYSVVSLGLCQDSSTAAAIFNSFGVDKDGWISFAELHAKLRGRAKRTPAACKASEAPTQTCLVAPALPQLRQPSHAISTATDSIRSAKDAPLPAPPPGPKRRGVPAPRMRLRPSHESDSRDYGDAAEGLPPLPLLPRPRPLDAMPRPPAQPVEAMSLGMPPAASEEIAAARDAAFAAASAATQGQPAPSSTSTFLPAVAKGSNRRAMLPRGPPARPALMLNPPVAPRLPQVDRPGLPRYPRRLRVVHDVGSPASSDQMGAADVGYDYQYGDAPQTFDQAIRAARKSMARETRQDIAKFEDSPRVASDISSNIEYRTRIL